MKLNKLHYPLSVLLCLLCLCVLLAACKPEGGEITTDNTADPTPDVTTADETTEAETTAEETTAEETTAEETTAEETTDLPEPEKADVTVFGTDGKSDVYRIELGKTLPSEVLENIAPPAQGEDFRAELSGFEYTVGEAHALRYDLAAPPVVTAEGMTVRPVIEYSYRVSFEPGEGRFPEGTQTSFFLPEGSKLGFFELLGAMPEREADAENEYKFIGFADGDTLYAEGDAFTLSAPTRLVARYSAEAVIYTVNASTEFGELPGGGKTQTFKGTLSQAEQYLAAYKDLTYADIADESLIRRFRSVKTEKNGKEWSIILVWESSPRDFDIIFELGEGYDRVSVNALYGDKVTLTVVGTREDEVRYYDFIGWRGGDGKLYEGGYELTVTSDMTFTAEFADGELKVYDIIFKTDIGLFENGKQEIAVSGNYGDTVIPPAPPATELLTFGEVVYEFVGWDREVLTVGGNAEYIAVYSTPEPVYFVEFYLNGELYFAERHYAGAALTAPERPEQTLGMIFSGWQELPKAMPAENIRIDAVSRQPEVIYILDGEVVLQTPTAAGTLVTVAPPAQKTGHTVSGWSTSDISDLTEGAFLMPESDVLFKAESTPNTYRIVYILDDRIVYTDTVPYGELYTLRGIEVMLGYEFLPWQPQDPTLDVGRGIFAMPDRDLTFIGSFRKCEYKVNYYLDGELIHTDTYGYGSEVVLRPDEVQAGCTFGWTTASAEVADGKFTMPAGDVDIYGHFSAGDNRITFVIDGVEYGSVGVASGETVDVSFIPTKLGYTFTGWSCEGLDVSSGSFIMPEGDIVLRGSFVPNVNQVIFVDLETGETIAESHVDYGAKFTVSGSVHCIAGKVSEGMTHISGNATGDGEGYIMPDEDVVFGITWTECLTVELEEDYFVPYYALIGAELESCFFDEGTGILHIYDPAVKVAGSSEGITVVFEYIA